MIIERLHSDVDSKGTVCVGLDTEADHIPEHILKNAKDIGEALFDFNRRIIDATFDVCAVYKVQIAYYESYGLKGMEAYSKTVKYIKSKDVLSIGDVKRGDIAKTAEMYAKAHFEGDFETDFITINPYMGFDSIEPYLPYVTGGKKGLFVLLRTSNPGAKDIEYLEANGKKVYNHIGDHLLSIGSEIRGQSGYSPIGAVVGGTHSDEAIEIRERYKSMFFLIPGYGAQGARGEDVRKYLIKGNGGIVNSSRGIIAAYKKRENGAKFFDEIAREEVLKMREDIGYGKSL